MAQLPPTPDSSRTATAGSGSTERTPLIPKSHSVTVIASDRTHEDVETYSDGDGEDGPKGREVEVYKPGKSTFTQTVRHPTLIRLQIWVFGGECVLS